MHNNPLAFAGCATGAELDTMSKKARQSPFAGADLQRKSPMHRPLPIDQDFTR